MAQGNTRITFEDLALLSRQLAGLTEWFDLGLQLKITIACLKEMDKYDTTSRKITEMLVQWLKINPNASREELASALIAIEHISLAERIMPGKPKFLSRGAVETDTPLHHLENPPWQDSDGGPLPAPCSGRLPAEPGIFKDSPERIIGLERPKSLPFTHVWSKPSATTPDHNVPHLHTPQIHPPPPPPSSVIEMESSHTLFSQGSQNDKIAQFQLIYAELQHDLLKILQEELEIDHFQVLIYVQHLPLDNKEEAKRRLSAEERQEIRKAVSIFEIFVILEKYLQYNHFFLLEKVVSKFGNDNAKKMMKAYSNDLNSSAASPSNLTGVKKMIRDRERAMSEISSHFAELLVDISSIMTKESINVRNLEMFIRKWNPKKLKKKDNDDLKKAVSVSQVFSILADLVTCDDYGLLQAVVKKFGSADVQRKLEQYNWCNGKLPGHSPCTEDEMQINMCIVPPLQQSLTAARSTFQCSKLYKMMDEGCQLSEWMTRLVAMNTAKQYHGLKQEHLDLKMECREEELEDDKHMKKEEVAEAEGLLEIETSHTPQDLFQVNTHSEAETVSGVSLESNLSSIDTGVAHTVETMTQIMSASAGRKKKRQTNAPTCTAASTTSTNSTTTDSTSINCSLVRAGYNGNISPVSTNKSETFALQTPPILPKRHKFHAPSTCSTTSNTAIMGASSVSSLKTATVNRYINLECKGCRKLLNPGQSVTIIGKNHEKLCTATQDGKLNISSRLSLPTVPINDSQQSPNLDAPLDILAQAATDQPTTKQYHDYHFSAKATSSKEDSQRVVPKLDGSRRATYKKDDNHKAMLNEDSSHKVTPKQTDTHRAMSNKYSNHKHKQDDNTKAMFNEDGSYRARLGQDGSHKVTPNHADNRVPSRRSRVTKIFRSAWKYLRGNRNSQAASSLHHYPEDNYTLAARSEYTMSCMLLSDKYNSLKCNI